MNEVKNVQTCILTHTEKMHIWSHDVRTITRKEPLVYFIQKPQDRTDGEMHTQRKRERGRETVKDFRNVWGKYVKILSTLGIQHVDQ